MRRKARLKVLYWPILASACIIFILMGSGSIGQSLRPVVAKWWAGTGLDDRFGGWLPRYGEKSDRSIATDFASKRPVPLPRTLTAKLKSVAPARPSLLLDARTDIDTNVQPRSIHSPHAIRGNHHSDVSPVAEVFLLAPQRDDVEELAGIEPSPGPKDVLVSSVAAISSSAPVEEPVSRTTDTSRRNHGLGGYPDARQLILDLEIVARVAKQKQLTRFASTGKPEFSIDDWQSDVATTLGELSRLTSVSAAAAGQWLDRLDTLASQGHEAGESLQDRELQIRMLRAVHGLDRRVAVWSAVWRTTQGTVARVSDADAYEDLSSIDANQMSVWIAAVSDDASQTSDAVGWSRFLMIDDLANVNQSGDIETRKLTAQRFLSRLTWHRLTDAQSLWLDRSSIRNLSLALRRWAATPIDYAAVLAQIERQESDAIDLGGIDVASAVQTLRFAESREANRIANSLNTHYRNANVRVAIADTMIARMIPEVEARVQPVRDNILGAEVRGTSVANSHLALRLVPSYSTWRMVLENHGRVDTGASSHQWPVMIRSHSSASFLSSTPLEISPLGIVAGNTSVDVQSATRVRGMKTEFDAIPVISSLVREIASNRYEALAPRARQIQQNKIRGSVQTEIDGKVDEQLDAVTTAMTDRLTGPLSTLRLNPMIVDMQTSESRLTARYRVAGDWQLAAFTPRPRAPITSLFSVQVHQSAINNTFETILPSGESKTINALIEDIRKHFGIEKPIAIDESEELAGDIAIQFAPTRPITVEIEDDIMWVTMRVVRLKQDRSIDLRRFIVRAGYRPQISGLSVELVREGHLRISGPEMSMRDRLPVRAIFNKVFSTRRTLPLIPPSVADQPAMKGLAVVQAELRDGWIAIAIGDANQSAIVPQIASTDEEEDGPKSQSF